MLALGPFFSGSPTGLPRVLGLQDHEGKRKTQLNIEMASSAAGRALETVGKDQLCSDGIE